MIYQFNKSNKFYLLINLIFIQLSIFNKFRQIELTIIPYDIIFLKFE